MRRSAWLVFLLSASASALAQKPAMWRLEEIANSQAPAVTLYKGPHRTQVGVLSTSRARLIVEAKTRLEQSAGVAAALVLVEGAPLRLALRGPEEGVTGQEVEWQLEVNNPGDRPAEGLEVTQNVPEGLTFVDAGVGGRYEAGRGEIAWTIPALAGKEARTLTFRLRGQRPGEWTLGAEVRARDRAPVRASRPCTT